MENIVFDLGGVLFARDRSKCTQEFHDFFSFIRSEPMPAFWEDYDRGVLTLDALQELTRLAVQAKTGERSRLMLDVAGFRAHRKVELAEVARAAIATVQETGEPVALAPMNPFERKVVHDVVAEAGLVSDSDGVEPARHVVVRPA